MNKNTPIARGVRTFLAVLAASTAAWKGVDWATDWRPGATLVTINIIAAFLAGLSAMLLAMAGITAKTAIGKALATFLQSFGTAVGAITVTELANNALINAGHAFYEAATIAISAAVISFILNKSEDSPPGNILGRVRFRKPKVEKEAA